MQNLFRVQVISALKVAVKANQLNFSSPYIYCEQYFKYRTVLRPMSTRSVDVNKIMDILDISEESALRIVKAEGTEKNVTTLLAVLKKYGFTRNTIVHQPRLLRLTPVAVENYILSMKETGFSNVEANMIYRFPKLCKRNISALESYKVVPKLSEIVKNYCEILELSTSAEDAIWSKLPSNTSQVCILQLRQLFMSHYFEEALNTTAEVSQKILKTYPRTHYRSFTWLKETIKVLLNDYEFTKAKVCKHGYLLQSNPSNLSDILNSIENLSGLDMKTIAQSRPKILMSSKESLLEIQAMFDTHSISPESVLKYPEIYTFSVATIRTRLEELRSIPEFSALKQHPRVGRLLYYQNKIKSRLQYLTSNNLEGASLHILSTDRKRFDKFLSVGVQKTKGVDVTHYLADYFNKKRSEIRSQLALQPHWLQIPLIRVEDTLRFLNGMNTFSKSALYDCLPILFYPKEKIEVEITTVIKQNEASLKDPYFLHMVIYFMERQVHFTGDGIWQNKVGEYESLEAQSSELST